jgi:diguanylate cyclase (GGDEF)-like protein
MELKIYLRILLKKWWVISVAFLATFAATFALVSAQTPIYQSTATFIVAPSGSFEDVGSFANGLEILSRRAEIATTYTEVAMSRLVTQGASDELELSPDQRESLSIESRVRAGTNVLEITAEGSDPTITRDFANMVGNKTIVYVQNLYEAYNLSPLDWAPLPTSPIGPNKKMNLAIGAAFGMILGVGLAFLSEYLQSPLESVAKVGIFDDETGAYNRRYFVQRLGEEMSRAKRNKYPLSLALMNVDQLGVLGTTLSSEARNEALRKVTVFLKQYLREEDIMARLEGTVFGFLLPDMAEEKTRETMEKLQTRIAWTPFEVEKSGVKFNLSSATGVVAYQHNDTRQDELMAQANRVLQHAQSAGYGKVSSVSDTESL